MRNNTICQAIDSKHLLSFTYDGTPRLVEPHAHGEDHDGDTSLRAFQVRGTGTGWRMFHIDKMIGLLVSQQSFSGPRPDYKRNDKDLAAIYCQL